MDEVELNEEDGLITQTHMALSMKKSMKQEVNEERIVYYQSAIK